MALNDVTKELLTMELTTAGLAREDIQITVKDDVLLVAGQQKARTVGDNASPAVQVGRLRPLP